MDFLVGLSCRASGTRAGLEVKRAAAMMRGSGLRLYLSRPLARLRASSTRYGAGTVPPSELGTVPAQGRDKRAQRAREPVNQETALASDTSDRIDVLIGGGGVAGLALAVALRQGLGAGFAVAVADPALDKTLS